MSLLGTIARVGAGIATGGLSEGAIAGYNALKPKPITGAPTSGAGSATYGTQDNPDWLAWQAKKTDIENQIKADPAWGNDPNGGQQELKNLGPEPPRTVQVDTTANTYAQTMAQGQQAGATLNGQVARINGVANQISANSTPQQTIQQKLAATPLPGAVPASSINPNTMQYVNNASGQLDTTANQANVQAQAQANGFNYTPPPSTVGAGTPNFSSQIAAAQNRQAPQITGDTGQAGQNAALAAAQGFQPNTSGIAAIQNARADTSGAAPLSNFQADQSQVQRLDNFNPTAANAGINSLNNFQTTNAQQGVQALNSFQNPNAAVGLLGGFRPDQSGQANLNAYANQAEGPSAAQALLQSGSDANIRQALALARSARGGPAAVAQAMRTAQSENAATQAQTSGQAAALRAQETDTFKQRQLAALQGAGQLGATASGQTLSALQATGQIITDQNAQQLQAKVAAGSILSAEDAQKLSAYQAVVQAQTAQDQQRLGATQTAAQVQAQNEATRQTALSNAANVNLQGSQINQAGAIAASNAQLAASGQKLQALSLQGQISDSIRTANVDTLKANLDASLQQANLNDTQVRQLSQIQEDARQANQNAQLQAQQLGLNAASVASAVNLQWAQMAQQVLTTQQQMDLAKQGIQVQINTANQANNTAFTNQLVGLAGTGLSAAGTLIPKPATSDERAKRDFRPVSGRTVAKALRDSPASEYEYTEPDKPGRAPGRHVGPMAQGLQRSKLFAPAVSRDKEGTLSVDGTRLALAHHAVLTHLQSEIDLIKKHRKGKREARA